MSAYSVPSHGRHYWARGALCAGLLMGTVGLQHARFGGARWTQNVLDFIAIVLASGAGAVALPMLSRRGVAGGQRGEQDQLAALSSNVAVILTSGEPFQHILQRTAEMMVESLDAAFVRIWTLNAEQNVLELKASAGMYTHLDGPHGRVPVGSYKIGRIAEQAKPHLSNSVQEDPWVSNKGWAKREGMVAFAGYPLMVEDRVEGVIAAFARHPLTGEAIQAFGSIAGSLALFIGHHRVETSLVESEQRVRLLLDSTAEAIYGIDLNGICIFANRASQRIFGYDTQADLLGRNLHELVHHTRPDGRPYPTSECKLARAILDGKAIHGDDEFFWRADGTGFPAEYWSFPVVKDGKTVGAVVSLLDISARKQAEEEQRKLALLVESSDDFIVIASPDRKVQYLNHGGARMIGLDNPQEAIGADISRLHPDAAWAQLESTIPIQVATGLYKCETQVKHWRTGEPIDVLLSAFVLRKPETGELVCLAAIMRDISTRKQAEQALRTSGERFRIAAESASDFALELDLKTHDVELFGLTTDRLGDQPLPRDFETWRSMVHPDDIGPLMEGIERQVQRGERYAGEYRVVGQDGTVYYYSVRGQAIRDSTGQPHKWIAMVSEITEHKNAEQALAQLAAIVQSSEDAIIGTGLAGIVTSWNSGAEKLLGYAAAEVMGSSISVLFPEPDRAKEILEPSVQGQVSRFDEAVLVSKSLATLPVSLTVSPIRDASGNVTGVAAIARDIRARKEAETALAFQVQHDHLTGLPNRLLLADRLAASIARARASGRMTAVLYLDLDGFKLVNDTLGHDAGDALLRQVTERLTKCVRGQDTLARMGGDEFMMVISEVGGESTAMAVAERLASALRKPFSIDGHELYLTTSAGISIYPRDGSDASTLRQNADAAMYEAKRAGKDRIRFFTPTMRAAVVERLELETDLRHALERGEFLLHFQPIFESAGGRQTSFEALSRWRHPRYGLISPDKFIPVAEETGLILRLGAVALQEACKQCREWQGEGLESVRVNVNVSPLEFARPEFVDNVFKILEETRLAGELLELEITEGVLVRDLEDSIRKMSRLHERGVRISIDDFGTGYSSLGYLPRLPIDTVKIDRSFVAQLDVSPMARSLIEGMISLIRSIGKRVIVEGVESVEQLIALRQLGCHEVQGFLLGRPGPVPKQALTRDCLLLQVGIARDNLDEPEAVAGKTT